MSMDANRLGDAWLTVILAAAGGSPVAADVNKMRTLLRSLAAEDLKEFIENAVLNSAGSTGPTASPGNPTPIPALPGVIQS